MLGVFRSRGGRGLSSLLSLLLPLGDIAAVFLAITLVSCLRPIHLELHLQAETTPHPVLYRVSSPEAPHTPAAPLLTPPAFPSPSRLSRGNSCLWRRPCRLQSGRLLSAVLSRCPGCGGAGAESRGQEPPPGTPVPWLHTGRALPPGLSSSCFQGKHRCVRRAHVHICVCDCWEATSAAAFERPEMPLTVRASVGTPPPGFNSATTGSCRLRSACQRPSPPVRCAFHPVCLPRPGRSLPA